MTIYVLPVGHGTPKTLKKGQNCQTLAVYCMVTMVTANIVSSFSFNSNTAWPDSHVGVLHDHICAFIGAWDLKKTPKRSKLSKIVNFLHGYHGYHGYGKYFFIFCSLDPISA